MRLGLGAQGRTLDEAVAFGRRTADDGFDSLWFSNIFGLDALTACAVVGREVPGLTVGTGVVPTYPRHPHALAQQAASVQQACGGRLVLGIGLSHQVVVESMFGLSYDKPARHMREYLSVLGPLLSGGKADFDGETYRVHAGLDVEAAPVPVVVAALGPVMLKVAGSLADGTTTWMTGVATLRDHIVPSIRAAAEEAGRPEPRVVVGLPVCVTDDVDAARARASKAFAVYGQLPSYRAMLDREGAEGPADVALVGDEEQVTALVHGLRDVGTTDFDAVLFGTPEEQERTRALLKGLVGSV